MANSRCTELDEVTASFVDTEESDIEEILSDREAGAAPESELVEYTSAQKKGQKWIEFTEVATASYILNPAFDRAVEGLPAAYRGPVNMSIFAVTDIVWTLLAELITKKSPLYALRAIGGGNAYIGLTKVTANSIVAGTVIPSIVGYLVTLATDAYALQMQQSSHILLSILGTALNEEAYYMPLMGTTGYFLSKGVDRLMMRMWERCWPSIQEEECPTYTKPHFLQNVGKYMFRWFSNAAFTATIVYYISYGGHTAIAADPRVKIGLFLFSDALLQCLGRYFAYTRGPIQSLLPKPLVPENYPSDWGFRRQPPLTFFTKSKAIVKKVLPDLGVYAVFCSTTYGLGMLTWMLKPELCQKDTVDNLGYLAIAGGVALAAELLARTLLPPPSVLAAKITTRVSTAFSSLFRSYPARRSETHPLLGGTLEEESLRFGKDF